MTTSPLAQAAELARIRDLIADDVYAVSFQTFGQYRSALLKSIDAALASQAVAVAEPSEHAENILKSWLDAQHPDDVAVDAFASKMRQKMASARAKGRGGWNDKAQCSAETLSKMLREHVEKGDPVDVANFAMMLAQRGERITSPPVQAPAEVAPEFCPCCDGSGESTKRVGGGPDVWDEPCVCPRCKGAQTLRAAYDTLAEELPPLQLKVAQLGIFHSHATRYGWAPNQTDGMQSFAEKATQWLAEHATPQPQPPSPEQAQAKQDVQAVADAMSDHEVALRNIASNAPRLEAASRSTGSPERMRCYHCGFAWQPDCKPYHALDCAYMDAVNALAAPTSPAPGAAPRSEYPDHLDILSTLRPAAQAPAPSVPTQGLTDYQRIGLLEWAVQQWRSSVQNRPLANIHRRTLDDTWRIVMRYAGGDPVALVGLSHDELLAGGPIAPAPRNQGADK